MQTVPSVLEITNAFPQDADIEFDEPSHVYSHKAHPGKRVTSVTTFIHHLFPEFNADEAIRKMKGSRNWNSSNEYYGMSAQEIKDLWEVRRNEAAEKGTIMHNNIECFMNQPSLPPDYTHQMILELIGEGEVQSTEWKYFLQFAKDHPNMVPFRTEMRIFDCERGLAGSIDMIYKNVDDGTLSIYDWKRSKEIKRENKYATGVPPFLQHLPDCNFYHYSLQLNTYKALLELNYGVKVRDLFLVVLHPRHDKYLLIECADLQREVLALLEDQRLRQAGSVQEQEHLKQN